MNQEFLNKAAAYDAYMEKVAEMGPVSSQYPATAMPETETIMEALVGKRPLANALGGAVGGAAAWRFLERKSPAKVRRLALLGGAVGGAGLGYSAGHTETIINELRADARRRKVLEGNLPLSSKLQEMYYERSPAVADPDWFIERPVERLSQPPTAKERDRVKHLVTRGDNEYSEMLVYNTNDGRYYNFDHDAPVGKEWVKLPKNI